MYIWMKSTPYGWHFKNEDFSIWHWYYGYNKREAIKKFREDFGLKYKRLKLIFE